MGTKTFYIVFGRRYEIFAVGYQNVNFWCYRISLGTVKILKFGTPQTIAIIVLKIEKFDVTLH